MLKVLFMLAFVAVGIGAAVVFVLGMRERQRKRVSRTRRDGDYAERRAQWRDYTSRNRRA